MKLFLKSPRQKFKTPAFYQFSRGYVKLNKNLTPAHLKNMIKETFDKWIKVLTKAENKNKELLSKKQITKDAYILLNKINADKYEAIVKQYHHELI